MTAPDWTPELAERAKTASAAATPEPWMISEALFESDWPRLVWNNPDDPRDDTRDMPHITDLDAGISQGDKEFLCISRTALPAAIAHIDAQDKRIAELKKELADFQVYASAREKELSDAAYKAGQSVPITREPDGYFVADLDALRKQEAT